MTDHLISMFIDDELDLDEKIEFVDAVHSNSAFKADTVDLLLQEKHLRQKPVELVPPINSKSATHQRRFQWLNPIAIGLGCSMVILFVLTVLTSYNPLSVKEQYQFYRFVIFRPDIASVEIAGTFTGWQPKPMHRIGNSGYWAAEFELPDGEHRFAYILDGHQRIADPTIAFREKDDFGGENSILTISL